MAKHVRLTAAATMAIIGLGAFAAFAASPSSDGTASPPPKNHSSMRHDSAESIEQRITDLHSRLKITPSQQPQWDQFAQVMRDNAKAMEEIFKTRLKAMPTMSAPQNMTSYAELAANHAQNVAKLVSPFQAVYDTMSDSQKRTADEVFREDAEHPHHGRHHSKTDD